jgi:hypothetical protein
MDTLRLKVGKREDPADGLVDAVNVFVNGRDLMEIARETEFPFATRDGKPDLAGNYVGLRPEEVLLPSRRLLGEPETYYDSDGPEGKLAVLGCVCGEPGCWPLLVRIAMLDGAVVWSDFEQPHRPAWRYDNLGPFVFDRSRYLAWLRRPSDARTY